MKCKAVRCIYYNAGNGYTVASYVTEETLPKEVSSQKNGRYGMFMAIGNELPTEDGLEVELNGTWKDGKFGMQYKVSSFQIVLPARAQKESRHTWPLTLLRESGQCLPSGL